ncbi:PRC-barrel domain-containing protein [Citreimonas salinaria]|uniref:PRC-barrel domain-containing protein n=1 Tax=Citreimonas salinaria TaxID=321339 RepID=A0A1H3GUQ1_9RHOB|nr:PRC-barrel domain-containing protein [Citreimonas salinaria]SDY07062.1 PRC-barrel domain-containing protein [Citreimonas salinaria]
MFNKSLGLALGTVSALALSTAAFAQSDDIVTNDEVIIIEGEEGEAEVAADVAGGQVMVEQGQPRVTVTLDEPSVDVDQARPQVDIEQPQPQIDVLVPEPNVRVQQQAPIITVEQAQPQVTVRIPEPIITIRVPRPSVDVNQDNPDVNVAMPEPIVNFVRPEPQINIQESEPRVIMEDSGSANVDIQRSEGADLDVNQEEAQVDIQQSGDANVQVSQAEPQVTVQDAEAADVNVSQAEPTVELVYETDEMGMMASEEDRVAYVAFIQESPWADIAIADIEGQPVTSADDERVGEVEQVGMRGETIVLITGVGGFLGMGERTIALPLDRVSIVEGRLVLDDMTAEEIEQMPEYNEAEVQPGQPDQTVGEFVTVD